MYRVTYEQGNGYHCRCCRHTSTETEDFDNESDMIDYLVQQEQHGDDWCLEEIREIKDEDLTNNYFEIIQETIINNDKNKARKKKIKQLKNKIET